MALPHLARSFSSIVSLALVGLLALVGSLGGGSPALAGDPVPAAPPAAPTPASGVEDIMQKGARYFDEAITWVARGGTLGKAVDLNVHLDAQWDLEENHSEGEQSVWYLAPDKSRTETMTPTGPITKILDGDQAWVVTQKGMVNRIHGTPGAEPTLKQMKEDLLRIQDLTQFVTLEGLKGPGVMFEFLGSFDGSGAYAGNWLKVARRSPDGRKITFWLAREKGADGIDHASWPGIVRVEGDPAQRLWTEDWILKEWDSPRAKPRAFRYPTKIQAWRSNPDPAQAKADPPRRFLGAIVDDIQINAGIPVTRYAPPAAPDKR